MIWTLTREQLRSQRRFVAWTGGMLAAIVALVMYATTMGATQVAATQAQDAISGSDDAYWGYASSSVDGTASADGDDEVGVASIAAVDSAIADAIAAGSDVQASRYTPSFVVDPLDATSTIVSVTGNFDWNAALASGTAPGTGQVALSARLADQLGVGIGDTVETTGIRDDHSDPPANAPVATPMTLTVSGITRSPVFPDDVYSTLAEAYGSWEDSVALSIAGNPWLTELEIGGVITTDVSWNVVAPDSDVFVIVPSGANESVTAFTGADGFVTFVAIALAIGLIVMSVMIGRQQAQARVTWVGTARAMGATRRTILAATALETLVVALVASAAGMTVGYVAALTHQTMIRAGVPEPLYPAVPVVSSLALLTLAAVTVMLAGLTGAIPAFWAARIEPVDALNEGTPPRAATNRRRQAAILYAWLLSMLVLILHTYFGLTADVGGVWGTVIALVAFVLSCAVAHRLLRAMIFRVGGRLYGSAKPRSIIAGHALRSRSAQFATPALVFAVLTTPMVLLTVLLLRPSAAVDADSEASGFAQVFWGGAFVALAVCTVIATVVSLAVFASDAQAARADGATSAALGATRADLKSARFAQFWVALVTGVALGSAVGMTLAVVLWLTEVGDPTVPSHVDGFGALTPMLIALLAVEGFTVLLITAGAASFASRTPKSTPVANLSHV